MEGDQLLLLRMQLSQNLEPPTRPCGRRERHRRTGWRTTGRSRASGMENGKWRIYTPPPALSGDCGLLPPRLDAVIHPHGRQDSACFSIHEKSVGDDACFIVDFVTVTSGDKYFCKRAQRLPADKRLSTRPSHDKDLM